MTPALILLLLPGLPSYNGVEVSYLKGVIGLPIVISFRDRRYIHIFFFFLNGLIDDVMVIGWTDSDFKISRALLTMELYQASHDVTIASSKLLLDHSSHGLRNFPINSQQLFDIKVKEVAKSNYEAQQHIDFGFFP